jgi:hypothetical protein
VPSNIDLGDNKNHAALGKNGHGYNALAELMSLKSQNDSPRNGLSTDRP